MVAFPALCLQTTFSWFSTTQAALTSRAAEALLREGSGGTGSQVAAFSPWPMVPWGQQAHQGSMVANRHSAGPWALFPLLSTQDRAQRALQSWPSHT